MKLVVKSKHRGELKIDYFNSTLRAMPVRLRRNLRILEFRVHPDTYLEYIALIAGRQGAMADQYLAGLIGNPTFGGVPITGDPDANVNVLELYHPYEPNLPYKVINTIPT